MKPTPVTLSLTPLSLTCSPTFVRSQLEQAVYAQR